MRIHKTTRITIEEQRVRTVSVDHGGVSSGFCEQCQATRAAFTPELASVFLRVNCVDISGLVDTAQIHVVEMRDGSRLICGHSLMGNGS